MRTWSRALVAAALALIGSAPARGDEGPHVHEPAAVEKFGTVRFPVSCRAEVRADFETAVAILHSFGYARAEKAFADIAARDARCAMAHWGIAMSLYHPVWAAGNPAAQPTPAELARGRAAVLRAREIGADTPRERDYIAAVAAFYKDSDSVDHAPRALAFQKGMEQVRLNNPQDDEAAIFYALSLLGTATPSDKTYANQRKAAELLNDVLPRAPDHPGVAHYLIHSLDYPSLAELALPAARAYARIAPSAPHALHMPSHIFTRLGLWGESIESNLASAAAARSQVASSHPGATAFDELHALDYLVYAYLQQGQDGKAAAIVKQLEGVDALDEAQFAAAYALAAIPSRYALERHAWTEAARLELRPASFPWPRFQSAEALVHFARAMGGARSGDLATARSALARLDAIRQRLVEAKDGYWADQVEIQRREAAGWIARAEGRDTQALDLLRAAAQLEDSTDKHPVTPGAVLPAREQLGVLLGELGRPAEALEAFEACLATAPGRLNSLRGAAQAAQETGDREKARDYLARIASLGDKSDGRRLELRETTAAR